VKSPAVVKPEKGDWNHSKFSISYEKVYTSNKPLCSSGFSSSATDAGCHTIAVLLSLKILRLAIPMRN
jgi:hypothetical protein